MQDRKSKYWKRFNFLGKFLGWAFLVVGIIVGAYGITMLATPSESDGAWETTIMSFVVAFLGFLMIKAKPYQPRDSTKNGDKTP